MEIVCFIHAQAIGDKENMVQGHRDFDLTDEGIKQAEILGNIQYETKNKISAIYSSDLIRSLNTAQIAFEDHEIIQYKDLREQDFGSVVGSLDSFLESNPKYLLNDKEKFNLKFPDGESITDVKCRVENIFFDIINNHNNDETIAISCHFTPLFCILSIVNDEPLHKIWPKEHFETGDTIHIEYDFETKEFDIIKRYSIKNLTN